MFPNRVNFSSCLGSPKENDSESLLLQSGRQPVVLNIYDMNWINDGIGLYNLGLGILKKDNKTKIKKIISVFFY
jgi:hypothetical protein